VSSLAGYVWASLGSPEAARRWSAAHVVRRLYRLGCKQEIEELIKWMDHEPITAFIGNGFPFYFFHAKQYLLIALARCAIDDNSLLKGHYQTFQNIALSACGHILIQKYAADIALAILKNSSNLV